MWKTQITRFLWLARLWKTLRIHCGRPGTKVKMCYFSEGCFCRGPVSTRQKTVAKDTRETEEGELNVTDELRKIGPRGRSTPAHQLAIPTTRIKSQSKPFRAQYLLHRTMLLPVPQPVRCVTQNKRGPCWKGKNKASHGDRKRFGSMVSHGRRQGLQAGAEVSANGTGARKWGRVCAL